MLFIRSLCGVGSVTKTIITESRNEHYRTEFENIFISLAREKAAIAEVSTKTTFSGNKSLISRMITREKGLIQLNESIKDGNGENCLPQFTLQLHINLFNSPNDDLTTSAVSPIPSVITNSMLTQIDC